MIRYVGKRLLLLIPVLLISMRSGTGAGSIAGFALGLLYDLMGSGTIGCMALVFTLIAFAVGVAGESIDLFTPIATVIVAVLASLITEIGYRHTHIIGGRRRDVHDTEPLASLGSVHGRVRHHRTRHDWLGHRRRERRHAHAFG